MKKVKFTFLFLVIICASVSGDIIPSGTPAKICVRIKNLDDYPGIAVILVSDCSGWNTRSRTYTNSYKVYRVSSDSSLELCRPLLYAIKKGYVETREWIKINWETDKNVLKSNLTIKSGILYNEQNIREIDIDLKIAGFRNDSMILYKSKQVYKYTYNRPDSVQTLNYTGDLSTLHKDLD
jgi:hypothetical protein